MNLQDKERIIKAFDDAMAYEDNFRPFDNGEDYFEAHYGQEPVYKKKVISLFGKDNCTLKIRQAPAQDQGRDLSEVYGHSGRPIPLFDADGYFVGYEFKDAAGKEIGTLTAKDGWHPVPVDKKTEEVHPNQASI